MKATTFDRHGKQISVSIPEKKSFKQLERELDKKATLIEMTPEEAFNLGGFLKRVAPAKLFFTGHYRYRSTDSEGNETLIHLQWSGFKGYKKGVTEKEWSKFVNSNPSSIQMRKEQEEWLEQFKQRVEGKVN